MFPRHVLEYMVGSGSAAPGSLGSLATSHEDVTILFMDIVGGWGGGLGSALRTCKIGVDAGMPGLAGTGMMWAHHVLALTILFVQTLSVGVGGLQPCR